jgi:hypothetical protein
MPKGSDFSPETRFIGAFVSESGNGKSAAAASGPKPYHQIDFDGRFDGVWGAFKENGGWLDDFDKVSFERYYPADGVDGFLKWLKQSKQQVSTMSFPYIKGLLELASMTKLVWALRQQAYKNLGGHVMAGELIMPGISDYKVEINGINQIYDELLALRCHLVFSCHILPKWGKPKPVYNSQGVQTNQYAPNEVTGEKLNLRDDVAEGFKSGFSNIFRFDRDVINGKLAFFVEFANADYAKNAYGIPPGKFDITNQAFWPFFQNLIQRRKNGEDLTKLQYKLRNDTTGMFGPIGDK